MPYPKGIRPRFVLIAAAVIAAVPILLFATVLVLKSGGYERASLEDTLWRSSRDALAAVDKTLAHHLAALTAVAAFLGTGPADFDALYAPAAAALKEQYGWTGVRLVDPSSGAILAEILEPGAGLPPAPPPDEVARVASTGQPTAMLFPGDGVARAPAIVLRVPVRQGGAVAHVLAASIDAGGISDILLRSRIPASWTVAAIDANFIIAGRSRAAAAFVGTPVTPSLRREIERATENFTYALTKEGERVYTLFTRSPASGWTIAMGAPAAVLEEPLLRARLWLIAAGAAAVLIAGALVLLLARNYERRQAAEGRLAVLAAEAETERRLSEIARNFPGVIYRRLLHPDGTVSYPFVSDGITRLLGSSGVSLREPVTFAELTRRLETDPAVDWKAELLRSARELTPYRLEGAFRRADGEERWLRSMALPYRQADGTVVWDGVALDISDEKRRETLLLEQAEMLDALNGINTEIAGELDLDRVVRAVADAAVRLTGAEFGAVFYRRGSQGRSELAHAVSGPLREAFATMPVPRDTDLFRPSFTGGEVIRLDDVTQNPRYGRNPPHHGIPAGHPPVRSYLAIPIVSRAGTVGGGIFLGHGRPAMFGERAEQAVRGIATQAAIAIENARLFRSAQNELRERQRAEERQDLLMAELDHRVRNILAVVQSLATSTLPRDAALEAYRGRLGALAHAHGLLAETRWQGAPLARLVRAEMAPYAGGECGGRALIAGEDLILRPAAAQTLVLAIHELTTNAVKYGALSTPTGTVEVNWRKIEIDGRPWLRIVWAESGGPPAAEPAGRGFGRTLIERGIGYSLSGRATFAFGPGGLRCEIEMPLDQVVAAE